MTIQMDAETTNGQMTTPGIGAQRQEAIADYPDPGLCRVECRDTGRGDGVSVIGYHNLTRPKSHNPRKA